MNESQANFVIERVKTTNNDECWIWPNSKNNAGYGSVYYLGSTIGTHVLAYLTRHERPLIVGLELHHRCFVKLCYNPNHLEEVTHKENIDKSVHWRSDIDTCPKGHVYSRKDKWGRKCNVCRREQSLAYYYRNREKILQQQKDKYHSAK